MARIRIATFNVENLGVGPDLPARIAVLRPALRRLRADVLCLQEVNAHGADGGPRTLAALDELLKDTAYDGYHRASTLGGDGQPLPQRNLVVLSRFEVTAREQYLNTLVRPPLYRPVTARPEPATAAEVRPERPVLRVRLDVDGRRLDVVTVHLKSRIPTDVPGQGATGKDRLWQSASGWAEGSFLSSMRRVGQALEVRRLVDLLFDDHPEALLVVCGDFNADTDEVPLQAVRGDVEETGNAALAHRVLVPCERTIPEPGRFSLYHHGRGQMLDHILVSRALLAHYQGTEIHNELLHDESVAFATDLKFPESDHAPVVASFLLD